MTVRSAKLTSNNFLGSQIIPAIPIDHPCGILLADIAISVATIAAACLFLAFTAIAAIWFSNNVPLKSASATPGTADATERLDFDAKWAHSVAQFGVFSGAQADVHTSWTGEKRVDLQRRIPKRQMLLLDPASHTAVYDISAHTVYLPSGNKLEAHSGLGSELDNPRSVGIKDKGPTPPNVYNLALREQLFHGVAALRLKPADETNMFGRDGILAHPYMMSVNGQSNGCVSFRDYPAFLGAYLSGEITRLIVVPSLDDVLWSNVTRFPGATRRYAAVANSAE